MKLQVALDCNFTADSAVEFASKLVEYVDIIEVGTPFVYDCGLEPVRKLKAAFPDKEILADFKIADAGFFETNQAVSAGADIITALGVTDDATIKGAVKAAHESGRALMVDMLSVADCAARMRELDAMGVDYICLHTAKDLQVPGHSDAEAFAKLKDNVKTAKLALAGGICEGNIAKYVEINPDLIIVGDGITGQPDPVKAAENIAKAMRK